jgi:AcrR family transcriptional regulator
MELVRSGDMAPAAARVAEVAGVSLRTVFRHFEEMDGLFREMSEAVEAEIAPLLLEPYLSKSWKGQLSELITRRARVYERVMPLKLAGALRRYQSEFLMEDHNRFLKEERASLRAVLPSAIVSEPALYPALEMTTSFEAWRRLRQDQRLSADRAEAVVRLTVDKLIAGR